MQAQVDANLTLNRSQWVAGDLHDERGMVAARTVQCHGDGGRWGGQRPGPAHGQVPDLRQRQATVGKDAEAAVSGEPRRLLAALALEPGLADAELRLGVPHCPLGLQVSKLAEVGAVGAVEVRDRLLQHYRRDLGKPGPLGSALGLSRHQPQYLAIWDERSPGHVGVLPQPQCVVVDDPGAAERTRERLALFGGRFKAVPVPELHAKQYPSLMRHDVRTGHHPVLTPHAHLLVHLPPTVALSRMGDSLNGVSSRRLRRESPQLAQHHWRAKRPWAGSYSAGSIAGDPVSVLRAHVEQHCEPDSAHPRPEGRGTPAESR